MQKLIWKVLLQRTYRFTTESKKPGDWCGITIYGDAPIKTNGGGSTATSEDGLNQIYGGIDVGSNSGVYRYIRVEYGGKNWRRNLRI